MHTQTYDYFNKKKYSVLELDVNGIIWYNKNNGGKRGYSKYNDVKNLYYKIKIVQFEH